jgi:hypothetical protein
MQDAGRIGHDVANTTYARRAPLAHQHQWLRFIFDPFIQYSALEEAEIIPGKDSDTRIKPLTLTNGHGRYMTVTPERTLSSVGKCPLDI